MTNAVPAHAVCRAMGCGRKAVTVIIDTKGRKQYCCERHDGSQRIKESKRWAKK